MKVIEGIKKTIDVIFLMAYVFSCFALLDLTYRFLFMNRPDLQLPIIVLALWIAIATYDIVRHHTPKSNQNFKPA